MYSNFITPPDYIKDSKHTVTLVNATDEEVKDLALLCKNADETYNVYLYNDSMSELNWLKGALDRSDSIIINIDVGNYSDLCVNEKTYYYGSKNLLSPSTKISGLLDYFVLRNKK